MSTNTMELNLNELGGISGGYIVKDGNSYTVIHDTQGYDIYTFTEAEYDFMMCMIRKWKCSTEFITWDKVEEIRKKNRDEYYRKHPEFAQYD